MANIAAQLQTALEFHQAGYLPRAEQLYRQILVEHPDDMDTNHLLGVLLTQAGLFEPALPFLRRAAALGGNVAMFYSSLADGLRGAGKIDEAIATYRHAAQLEPQSGEHVGKLGILLQAEKRYDEALACYEQALQLNPRDGVACNNAGAILLEKRDFAGARTWLERALSIERNFPQALNNLGIALRELREWKQAENSFLAALQLKPDLHEAHKHLGVLFGQMGDVNGAVRSLQQAVQLAPRDHEAHDLLAVALNTLDRLPEAAQHLELAIRLKPDFADAFANLGLSYGALGMTEPAAAAFARALQLGAPDGVKVRAALLVPVVPASVMAIPAARQRLHDSIAALCKEPLTVNDPVEEICRISFYPAYHGLNDRDLNRELARLFVHATPSLNFTAPHCQPGAKPKPRPDGKRRVAFISRYFYNHSVGIHNFGVIRDLPRDRYHVTLVRFDAGDDALSKAINAAADETLVLTGPLRQWRETLAAHEFDIVCYTDLGMDPSTYFLSFARLAPVQCVLPGHPVTTGIPSIDYYISSDDLEPADAQAHYSEQLVRLEHLPSGFIPLERSKLTTHRADYELPEDANLYVCPQMPFKIHPEFDALAGDILRRDPRGRLIMFHDKDRKWSGLLADRLRRGLSDVADRIMFLGRLSADGFYHFLTLADVVLDSVHFSGGTTSCQALSLGIPVVTLPGEFMRGRVTYALYKKLGVMDCVARDRTEYVELAVKLAQDRAWRESISGRIQAAIPQALPSGGFAQELAEQFERWLQVKA